MDPRTQERVEQWDSRPFSGGYDGLADLAGADFSGAVDAAGTWLFILNGRIVGVVDGTIEDVQSASGTVYDAPDPALPLLCTMEERGGETRAKYYTNETPLREVDETLQEGSFTGYVELSENVLSGDYYAVYYGGRRMAAAYIGNAERLLTGEEAFERADDEVGIYEVRDVDIEVTDVPGTGADDDTSDAPDGEGPAGTNDDGTNAADDRPEPSTDPTESAIDSIDVSGTGADATATDDGATESVIADVTADDPIADPDDGPTGITAAEDTDPEPASSGITDAEPSTTPDEGSTTKEDDPATGGGRADPDGTGNTTESRSDPADRSSTSAPPDEPAGADADSPRSTTGGDVTSPSSPDPAEVEAAAQQLEESGISWTEEDVESTTDDSGVDDPAATASPASPAATEDGTEERFEEEEQWRETRRIPSIDPDNSATGDGSDRRDADDRDGSGGTSRSRDSGTAAAGSQTTDTRRTEREPVDSGGRSDPQHADGPAADVDDATDRRVAELTDRIETLEAERNELASTARELEAERDRLQSKNEELASTAERLRSRIETLETELERAGEGDGDASDRSQSASTRLSPDRALAGTNLFVRYDSKSQPTLETAHEGDADRSDVAANLRLEHHTGFDASDVAVDGTPYAEYLPETLEYRFVDWLTEQLLYEIRDTGNAGGLGDLYDAIPRIDRAEFDASISLADDDTEDVPDQVSFDVVAFDKRGNPLVVATLNDSRDPATREMLERMEETASAVKANYPDLASAIVVTSSFFEPGALEVAETATSGSILSRGSKLSYVNLSRKQGYHLCLVEARSEGFHVNVPDL